MWTVDGEPSGVEGPEVDGRLTEAGQPSVVTVTPSDGEADGEPLVRRAGPGPRPERT